MSYSVTELKQIAIQQISGFQDNLWQISRTLHKNPEIAFHEFKAYDLLTTNLANLGYALEHKLAGLETAFRARLGADNQPIVAILAEYDALPVLGHACGHNLIAASAIGAAAGLAAVKDELPGQIQVIGTPAEEGGGGKILLAQAGVFNNISAAMMFHPANKNMTLRPSLASSRVTLEFIGKASHAAAAPEEGINALDALLLTFNNINALRGRLTARDRVAGIITHGGEVSNIIPHYTTAQFSIRSHTQARRDALVQEVLACAHAGAQAIGCQLKYEVSPGYADIIPNRVIAQLFDENLHVLGRSVVPPDPFERMGSTDMGDVSHLIPSIHAYLAIAPEEVAGHTDEFRAYSISAEGKAGMLDAAKALTMTTIDLLTNPSYLTQARQELDVCLAQN
jgi:amidohydrolase